MTRQGDTHPNRKTIAQSLAAGGSGRSVPSPSRAGRALLSINWLRGAFSGLAAVLSGISRKPAPSPLALAYVTRRRAAEAYARAVEGKDTRSIHWALKRFQRAQHDLLRIERESAA